MNQELIHGPRRKSNFGLSSARYLKAMKTLIVLFALAFVTTANADQITWISDSTTSLDLQITGTVTNGGFAGVSNLESPSGLWNVYANFSFGWRGTDSEGNMLYAINWGQGEENYWNGAFFYQAGWGAAGPLPQGGSEGIDGESFFPASIDDWFARSGVIVSGIDPNDSSLFDYKITVLAGGPAFPALSNVPDNGLGLAFLVPFWAVLIWAGSYYRRLKFAMIIQPSVSCSYFAPVREPIRGLLQDYPESGARRFFVG